MEREYQIRSIINTTYHEKRICEDRHSTIQWNRKSKRRDENRITTDETFWFKSVPSSFRHQKHTTL